MSRPIPTNNEIAVTPVDIIVSKADEDRVGIDDVPIFIGF